METISSWLESNISESNEQAGVSLVHGDFRLDNLVFDPDDPTRILAVLDWELTTVGDPLGDLAYSCLGHYIPPTGFLKKLSLLGPLVMPYTNKI
jgi:aminoglycoside phosphotransferase (APT) family kinase protein